MVESWIYKLAHLKQGRLALRNPRVNSDTVTPKDSKSVWGTAATDSNRDLAAE